ncbi:unnamed protein product [Urochloa decumbens]|uniref:Plant disease resistance WDH domain-containing protein n=1 Tax=Urochloa decumbens TaxID=240449 RepID=A0ABC9B5K7_9POAL
MAAASSSSSGTARGIHIREPAEEARRPATPWTSHGVDDSADHEESAAAMARECDVYVGHGGDARRLAAWLRAELELLGVPCVACDRRLCADAPSHAAARAAMDAASAGVVLVTPATPSNPYALDEARAFLSRGALLPVFVGGARRGELAAAAAAASDGDRPWMAYDGAEEQWREAVEGIARVQPAVEVGGAGDLRERVLDVLGIVGALLGRRAVAPTVAAWRAEAALEIPFPRNAGFVGRVNELLDLESMLLLRGGAAACTGARDDKWKMPVRAPSGVTGGAAGEFLDGVVCIAGASGAGKTELAVEFAHRHAHEYKKVLWVHGEARYLRQSYLKLADRLGVAVGDTFLLPSKTPTTNNTNAKTLYDIEGDAIAKINKELARDIPYLLVIDNLESDKDWWDGRAAGRDLLPRGCRRTRVLVTTRLAAGVHGVRTLTLGHLDDANAMRLMTKGTLSTDGDTAAVLREIQETVAGATLGLALVGGILSEVNVGAAELRRAIRRAPHRAPAWEETDDAALRDNPGLVGLLDACFALMGRDGGAAALRVLEASSFFAPAAPVPAATLVDAAAAAAGAGAEAATATTWGRFKRSVTKLPCASSPPRLAGGGGGGGAEEDALDTLMRLGIARRSTREGCVSVHGVFRLFARKAGGSGRAARAAVAAIAAAAAAATPIPDDEHTWAACLSLFRFESPEPAAELPPPELGRFVATSVIPLAARCVAGYSAYAAALELLREATDGVFEAEERYIGQQSRRSSGCGGGCGYGVEVDPRVYRELARVRAELLVMRARVMLRAGEHDVAEDHCRSAIGILEVVRGDWHPDTMAVRAFLEQDVIVHKTMEDVSEPVRV